MGRWFTDTRISLREVRTEGILLATEHYDGNEPVNQGPEKRLPFGPGKDDCGKVGFDGKII